MKPEYGDHRDGMFLGQVVGFEDDATPKVCTALIPPEDIDAAPAKVLPPLKVAE